MIGYVCTRRYIFFPSLLLLYYTRYYHYERYFGWVGGYLFFLLQCVQVFYGTKKEQLCGFVFRLSFFIFDERNF